MALTTASKGALHPGGSPTSIHMKAAYGKVIYTVPEGRILYVYATYGTLMVNDIQVIGMPRGGSTNNSWIDPCWFCAGDVIKADTTNSYIHGVEIDL